MVRCGKVQVAIYSDRSRGRWLLVTILSSSICYPVNGLLLCYTAQKIWISTVYCSLRLLFIHPRKLGNIVTIYRTMLGVDRNRYCTEYKKSWRTHSSNKQTFIPKCPIVANTPPSTMHCNRYVISDLLHSLVSRHVWRPLMNTSHPSLAGRK